MTLLSRFGSSDLPPRGAGGKRGDLGDKFSTASKASDYDSRN